MAEKYIRGIEHADEKARQILHKFDKKRPLSQLEQQYNFIQSRPTLSVPIDDDCKSPGSNHGVEVPALAEKAKHAGSSRTPSPAGLRKEVLVSSTQRTKPYKSVKWMLANAERENYHPYIHSAASSAKATTPTTNVQTASDGQVDDESHSIALKIGMPSLTPEDEVKLAKKSHDLLSQQIHDQWKAENRTYVQDGIHVKGKDTNSQQPQQWLPFRVDSVGAVDAFTPRMQALDDPSTLFEIETSIGKVVAPKMRPGNQVRVGKNGEIGDGSLGSESAVIGWQDATATSAWQTPLSNIPHQLTLPLSMEDAAKNLRVLSALSPLPQPKSEYLCETHPVVYNPSTDSKPYVPLAIRTDSTKVQQQLKQHWSLDNHKRPFTSLSFGRLSDLSCDVTYEDVLHIRAPVSTSAKGVRHNFLAGSSGRPAVADDNLPVQSNPPTTAASSRGSKWHITRPHTSICKAPVLSIKDEFRRCMKRQVTMPSYTVVPDVTVSSPRRQKDTSTRGSKRTSHLMRPPPSAMPPHKIFGGTVPSITPHGVQGDKEYVELIVCFHSHKSRGSARNRLPSKIPVSTTGATDHDATWSTRSGNRNVPSAASLKPGVDASDTMQSPLTNPGDSQVRSSSRMGGTAPGRKYSPDIYNATGATSTQWYEKRESHSDDGRGSHGGGSPLWHLVSIPTAGAPSVASDDENSQQTDSAEALADERRVHDMPKESQGQSVRAKSTMPVNSKDTGVNENVHKWAGGAQELKAMRSHIQEDLARTRIETERFIESINAKKQRRTTGHMLAQPEW